MEEWKDYLNLDVSEDEMEVGLTLRSGEYDDYPTVQDLRTYMQEQGIVYGILDDALNRMCEYKIVDNEVFVAQGTKPVQGKDGYYSYTFNTNPDKKPRLNEDGSVDYRNLNLIQCVEEGDLLAKYFEKVDGIPGRTVKGKELMPAVVKNLLPLRGKGFTVTEDRIEYYAAFDGKVEVSNGVLTVLKISTIPGDVDLSVGNLDVKGDLEILGNVRAGMIVKAKGNITVKGLVEAAEIEAGKDVLIKGGVLGGGKARIQGGGNVYAQFIENAAIKCGNCVQADSIVNSIVEAYNDVNIFGKTSAIIGGMITANRVIRTKYIGSSAQVLTRLHVGIEASTLAEIQQKELRFAENEKELDKIEKAMKMLKASPDCSSEMLMLLTRTKIEKTTESHNLKAEITHLLDRVELAKRAMIIAEEMAYQGTIVNIDGLNMRLNDDFEKIVFVHKGDHVLTKLYVEEDFKNLYV